MNHLAGEGVETLMLEGGSALNFSMIKDGLIDEIRVCVAPKVVGGVNAKSLFGGDGFDSETAAFHPFCSRIDAGH